MGGLKWFAQIGKLLGRLLWVTKVMVIDRKEDIIISSLFMFIQQFQPIKGYLWIIVARIIVDSTVKN